jgi:hypothetical protein
MNTPVGYIISWHVPQVVELQALRTALTQAGLDPDLAPDLKPAALVARTAGFIAKLTSNQTDTKRLSRPVGHAARQITREEVVNDTLAYAKEAALTLDQNGAVACDDPTIAQMVPSSSSEVWRTRTASDVTRIVQKVVESVGSDLIPVREQGGAYFVPDGHRVIGQIGSLLQSIGGSLSTFACMLGHGTDLSVASVITDYMLKQIGELKTAIDELNEKGIRSDVKSRRLTRVAELRERIGAYAALIGTQEQKLTDALNVAEATLLAKLGPQKDDEEPPADDSPIAA